MSQMVGNDPQFSSVHILRPYNGFETVYQGQAPETLLMWSEISSAGVNTGLDPLAGRSGYSPNLVAGLSVPYGAKLSIWLPMVAITAARDNTTGIPTMVYSWRAMFRIRNLRDYDLARKQFHMPMQRDGIPDTTASPTARVTIPSAVETIKVNNGYYYPASAATSQGRVMNSAGIQSLFVRREEPVTGSTQYIKSPIFAGPVFGEIQQGSLPVTPKFGGASGKSYLPFWFLYETEAKGDELVLGCYKEADGGGTLTNWDFAADAQDEIMSALFGTDVGDLIAQEGPFPSLGAYVLYGKGAMGT